MARITGNEASFATAVLNGLGAPVTQSNLDFIERWITREGGGGANNPLNTTQQMNGSTVLAGNSAGVQNYGNLDVGVQATVKTLENGFYPNIVAALKAGNAEQADAQGQLSQDLSTWSGGGYTTVANVTPRPSNSIGSTSNPAGGVSSGAGRAGSSANAVYGDIDGFLQSQAPALAAELSDPAVKSLLQQWGSGQLSDQQFQNQLENTKWWKNTPQSQRTLLVSQATDPATAKQNLDNQAASINTLAAQLGVGLPTGVAQKIALDSINGQWSNDQIQQQVAQYAKYQGDITYKGEAATDVNTLRGIYQAMALPVDDQTLNQQLQNLLGGKLTAQQIQDQAATQAATFYASNPQLAEFLKSGQGTAQQWAAPLISHVANILGTDPNSIDLTNPQWTFLLKPQTNPQTGQSTGMAQTLDSVEQTIKTDPVYQYSQTANGINDYSGLIDKLRTVFTGGGVA